MPRVKLSELYQAKRETICNNLIEIVGTEFYLCDLDNDISKINEIMSYKDEIPRYFAVSGISTYKKKPVLRDYLNLLKGVLKQQGYCVTTKKSNKKLNDSGTFQQTSKYTITRENQH